MPTEKRFLWVDVSVDSEKRDRSKEKLLTKREYDDTSYRILFAFQWTQAACRWAGRWDPEWLPINWIPRWWFLSWSKNSGRSQRDRGRCQGIAGDHTLTGDIWGSTQLE